MTDISFKVKYCHKVFLNTAIRKRCEQIFRDAEKDYGFDIQDLGFDEDHCHMVDDLGMKWSVQQVVKVLKGRSGRFLLEEFPWLRRDLFRKNRFWSPAYYFDSIGKDEDKMRAYVKKQKLSGIDDKQTSLTDYPN